MNIIELHSSVWEQLRARRRQLPHALLLTGQRGIGKFALARSFAASLLCENLTVAGEACGAYPTRGLSNPVLLDGDRLDADFLVLFGSGFDSGALASPQRHQP